jgi:hypothetical protein
MTGASVDGWEAHVNRHIRGFVCAATTRSASVRTGVKDAVTLLGQSRWVIPSAGRVGVTRGVYLRQVEPLLGRASPG